MKNTIENNSARLATLGQLLQTTIPAYLAPTPSPETLRAWFDRARIPRFKANPAAKRGGGPVFYSVSAVEKLLQSRTLPCRLAPAVPMALRPSAEHGRPEVRLTFSKAPVCQPQRDQSCWSSPSQSGLS